MEGEEERPPTSPSTEFVDYPERSIVEVEPLVATTIKGWASGTAWLHAGKPWLDPSRVDNAPGVAVFRRGGFVGNAEA